ncbi:MAG: hypothetical protein Q9191_002024 [Dirinaria sp. TL-2023a]
MSALKISTSPAPQELAPLSSSTMNKPLAPTPGSLQIPSIFTNKQWVVPPRPKPGRKPAEDTPPTKRKAQNREAQRAFRERRAARVGELEEQMDHMAEEYEKEKDELNARIKQLEGDVERCKRLAVSWSAKCQALDTELGEAKRGRNISEKTVAMMKQLQYGSDDTVPLPSRPRPPNEAVTVSNAGPSAQAVHKDESAFGCGKCRIDTRCECIDKAFEMPNIAEESSTWSTKRPHSPTTTTGNGKPRQKVSHAKPEEEGDEIDFTARFAAKPQPALTTSTSSASAAAAPDPCGFCQEGTACICAELAAEQRNCNELKEPPTSAALKLISDTLPNPCANGPGTCTQCRADENSTFFCKSLAATRALSRPDHRLRVSRDTVDLPFSRENESSRETESNNTATASVSFSCADAYTTLSRHPGYNRAKEDPESWMPKLTTVPTDGNMTAFDIEAASILQTLKYFDKRFGAHA